MKAYIFFAVAAIIAVLASVWFAFALKSTSSTLLQPLVGPGPLSSSHAFLNAQCSACHEANVGVTATKCTVCHANAESLLSRQPTAFHENIQECGACHAEHLLQSIRPLIMDHVALANIGAKKLGLSPVTDSKSTLAKLDCSRCHDRQDPHQNRFGSECAQCHGLETWSIPRYQHPSSGSVECVQCHKPPPSHLMMHFSMVSRMIAKKPNATVEQCSECHKTTSWNDIVGVGFYKHH